MGQTVLEVCDLGFDYPDKSLLRQVRFVVTPGTLLHVQGDNGVGKTTLLKLLAGLLSPSTGDLRYAGTSIYNDLNLYQKQICYVGHRTGVSQRLTVREYCQFDLNGVVRYEERLCSLGLNGLENVLCGLLSQGQRRRVGLLRLGVTEAPLWLLDEPFAGLDKDSTGLLMSQIKTHCSIGGQVVVTSHHPLSTEQHYEVYGL